MSDKNNVEKRKISLFFGAGAEIGYGLPSGGKFALDIFKMDTTEDKKEFRDDREKINKKSTYAKNWLPMDFEKKPISSFGKTQYEALVKSSLEYKRFEILSYLNSFDEKASRLAEKLKLDKDIDIQDSFQAILKIPFGSETFGHEIQISKTLGDYNTLFSSEFFSSFLKIIESSNTASNLPLKRKTREFCRAILELLIGACGEQLVHNLNDGIFEKKPDEIDIFDDLGSIFSLDYRGAGLTGLELLLNREESEISDSATDIDSISHFSYMILEDIFSTALDYQSLIDSNWRYLYSPKTDWAKFCRISIFLKTTKRYILRIADKFEEKILSSNGFYHDIEDIKKKHDIRAVGTTNYNKFIETISREEVYFLNGSVSDLYDPYLNTILSEQDIRESQHFTLPFLFTQSGIKPLTSIKMSERYVNLYHDLKNSDVIAIVGYGFNSDDGHINGMFRSLIEDEGKTITIFHYTENFQSESDIKLKSHYQERLRINSADGLEIIKIDRNRKNEGGLIWHACLDS